MSTEHIHFASESDAYAALKIMLQSKNKWLLLCDDNTEVHCKDLFLQKLPLNPDLILVLKSGEANKNLEQVEMVYSNLLLNAFDRYSAIVNLGGGMISDLGGFAAATYKRGISFVNIPTTLLSMVDASYGGKTGLNFKGIKNQIGVFKEADFILNDIAFLESLNQEEVLSGFAEIIKHALIADKASWEVINTFNSLNELKLNEDLIKDSIKIKNTIALRDPFEKGERKKLNFGHTIGHAIETQFNNTGRKISHGRAVALGMIVESVLSEKSGCGKHEIDEIVLFLEKIYGKVTLGSDDISALLDLMYYDKKNKNNELNLTLLRSIGNAVEDIEIDPGYVRQVLLKYSHNQ